MENQTWDDDVSTDTDEAIARLEAEIANEKAILSRLIKEEDLLF